MVASYSSKLMVRVQVSILAFLLLSSVARAEWTILEPVEENTGGILGDIYSQVNKDKRHIYVDPTDNLTSGHELCHFIHSRLRNKHRKNGFYLLKNKAFIIDSPKVTLKEIAEATPKEKRGRIYNLYLIEQQKYWNDYPLYTLDECVAYINGCLVGIEYNLRDRTIYSFDNAKEMFEYVKIAQELSRKSGFSQQKELDEFLDWLYINRVQFIEEQIGGWHER